MRIPPRKLSTDLWHRIKICISQKNFNDATATNTLVLDYPCVALHAIALATTDSATAVDGPRYRGLVAGRARRRKVQFSDAFKDIRAGLMLPVSNNTDRFEFNRLNGKFSIPFSVMCISAFRVLLFY